MTIRTAYGAAVAFVALTLLAAPASARENVDFAVEPAPGSATDGAGSYVMLGADPGQTVEAALRLRNPTENPVEIRLAAVDALTGALGGVTYGLGDEPAVRVGSWISLPTTSVTLASEAMGDVAFTVSVPAGARAGQHIGGIAAWTPIEDGPSSDSSAQGASVRLQPRRVVAVEVMVTGPAAPPALVVVGVTSVARADGLHLAVAIENRGGRLSQAAEGTVKVPALGLDLPFHLASVVPDAPAIAYVLGPSEIPRGTFEAKVEVRHGSDLARWDGSFTVGQAEVGELADRRVVPESPVGAARGGQTWSGLILGAAATMVVTPLLRARRRWAA